MLTTGENLLVKIIYELKFTIQNIKENIPMAFACTYFNQAKAHATIKKKRFRTYPLTSTKGKSRI